jgi:hypothetical protein
LKIVFDRRKDGSFVLDLEGESRYDRHRLVSHAIDFGSVSVLRTLLLSKYENGRHRIRIPMKSSMRLSCLSMCAIGIRVYDVDFTFWKSSSENYTSDDESIHSDKD